MLHYNYIRPDSGRYCILARHAKDEMNAARHSRKVGQPGWEGFAEKEGFKPE